MTTGARRQRVAVLGATGSIGVSTLDVLARHPERYEVHALTAHGRVAELAAQCALHRPAVAVVADGVKAAELEGLLRARGLATEVLHGPQALQQVAAAAEVDIVMAAIVGAAGMMPALAAARAGKRLLLANKEALVLGGALFMQAVREGGGTLLPIDSEHSAIFQCLPEDPSTWAERISHLVLTASGGPFRDADPAIYPSVTPEQAVAHPNWSMGRKISVDSATMMNKGLEVIEARWLFDTPADRIQVVIHPQSIIHSAVVCKDQSVLAQLGTPDMRVPIAYGLAWPERIESGALALDFFALQNLTFKAPDPARYPCLELAFQALRGQEGGTGVLNAANEVAVEAFLDRQIRFDQISAVNAEVLGRLTWRVPVSLEETLALDHQAREAARAFVATLAR